MPVCHGTADSRYKHAYVLAQRMPRDESRDIRLDPLPADSQSAPRCDDEDSRFQHLTTNEYNACVGMGKALHVLAAGEAKGSCALEKDSLYGAAIAMPQIARSACWPRTMVVLTIRTFFFLFINYVVQILAVYYVYDAMSNMAAFASQMHLCDFGAHMQNCPGDKNCLGPSGTDYETPGRLYSYDAWSTRTYARDALASILHDRADEVHDLVDPGEYGLESYTCRILCVFIFMVAVADEFQNLIDLLNMLYHLPSEPGLWISYEPPTWDPGDDKDYMKSVHGLSEIDLVKFRVAGMPLVWKVINLLIVFVPKLVIWYNLTFAGVYFLMETAGIVDQLVNSTALGFILNISKMFLERMSSKATKHIMQNLRDYPLFDASMLEHESDEEVLERYFAAEMNCRFRWQDYWLFPRRLTWAVSLMCLFVWKYYDSNCTQAEDGSWVSKDMYLPKTVLLNPLCLIGACSKETESSPYWTMP